MIKFGIVIVTYNRIDKLKKTLNCYKEQTYLPYSIVVINNASKDGTKEFLENWCLETEKYKKYVINLDVNLGGSGGFFFGEKKSLEIGNDWILVADDDAYPDKNYLEIAKNFIEKNKERNISAICGKVFQHGSCINPHRGFINYKFKLGLKTFCTKKDYDKDYFKLECISYVGLIMKSEALKKVGLVNKDLFIYYDDTEHGIRLNKYGDIICIPKMEFLHDANPTNIDLVWKRYYRVRNQVYMINKHFKGFIIINVVINIIKSFLCVLKGKSFSEVKMRLIAIKDGLLGNLGKHKKYKP